MHALQALILSAAFAIPALAKPRGDGNCTPLTYNEFEDARRSDESPHLGPLGMYASTPDDSCIYVDCSVNGAFAKDFTSEYEAFMHNVDAFQSTDAQVAQLPFLSGATLSTGVTSRSANEALEALENRQVSCGAICSASQSSTKRCNSCGCKFDSSNCYGTICTVFYRCK